MKIRLKGFTLIELLVVMTIIMVLAGLLLAGIAAARRYVNRARTKTEIDNMMMAMTEYNNEFGNFPPGGKDVGDDGFLDNAAGDDLGSGKVPADPNNPSALELQLRTITVALKVEGGNRTVGPYYSPNQTQIVNGRLVDVFGNPLRYLADGRRTTTDANTGMRMLSRVDRRAPALWSIAEDARQDPQNDNLDNDNNGKVDDAPELINDITSW